MSGGPTRLTRSIGLARARVAHMIVTGATGLLVLPNCAAMALTPPTRRPVAMPAADLLVAAPVRPVAIGTMMLMTSGAVPTAVPVMQAISQGTTTLARV